MENEDNEVSQLQPVTVSALTKYLQAKFSRDVHLQHVKLSGELSNVKFHNKGHLYFTLKDEYSRISGMMFAQMFEQVKGDKSFISDGMEVVIEGSIRVYEGTGTYQIYANQITPSGTGILQKEFEKLFDKYKQLGYFDSTHKKTVPKRIHNIAIVTAIDGAAIEDMRKSINSHLPHVKMKLFPTLVQGEKAPKHIAASIQKADSENFDAIIVGRGGGSLEDLWAFNTAEVIEAIFQTNTPIISAVGHEIDTMLSDYVADFRAPTPTAAIYYFDSTDLLMSQIQILKQKAAKQISSMLQLNMQTLHLAQQQLKELDPQYQIERKQNILQLEKLRLLGNTPQTQIDALSISLQQTKQQLESNMVRTLEMQQASLLSNHNKLQLLNPIAQLDRGYALVYDDTKLIKQLSDIQSEFLNIRLSDGEIYVKVVSTNGKDKGKK